jgi:hypothetical protein
MVTGRGKVIHRQIAPEFTFEISRERLAGPAIPGIATARVSNLCDRATFLLSLCSFQRGLHGNPQSYWSIVRFGTATPV